MTMTLDSNVSEVKETADTPPASPYGPVVSIEPATFAVNAGRHKGEVHTLSTAEKVTFEDGTVRYRCKRCGANSKLYVTPLSIRPHGIVHRDNEAPVTPPLTPPLTPPMPQRKRGRSIRTRLAPQIEELLIAQIDGAVKDATKELTQERDAWKARALDSEMKLAKLRAALTSL